MLIQFYCFCGFQREAGFELRESKRIEDCLLLKGQVNWSWKGNMTWRRRGNGREESLWRQERGGEEKKIQKQFRSGEEHHQGKCRNRGDKKKSVERVGREAELSKWADSRTRRWDPHQTPPLALCKAVWA